AAARHYRTITTSDELRGLVEAARPAGRLAIHVENTDTNGMRGTLVGIAVATKPGEAAYIPVGHQLGLGEQQLKLEDVLEALRPLLKEASFPKLTHNGHFDFLLLANHGRTM